MSTSAAGTSTIGISTASIEMMSMCTGYIFYHCLDLVPWSLEFEWPLKGHLTQVQRSRSDHTQMEDEVVEFWGLPPLILFFNMSTGWFGRFTLSTECYRTRKLGYKNLNWPRCSAWVTESSALTNGGFCQKQTLYILEYVTIVSLWCVF